jgi:DNA ligase-1
VAAESAAASTLFVDLARASERAAATRSRLLKRDVFVELLASVARADVPAAVGWLIAEPLCGPLGVGPAQLWTLSQSEAPDEPSVTLCEVEAALEQAKAGPRAEVLPRVAALFSRLTQPERALFVGALTGSLRQGSLGGVMLLALAGLSGLDEATVRKAVLVAGSVPRAAASLLAGETSHVLELFRPLAPMLASPAESLDDALRDAGPGDGARLVEWKVDGVRAQVHKVGSRIAVFSRQGNDITAGCATVVPALVAVSAERAIADGEVVLVDSSGVARPFQDTFSAVASKAPAREGDRLRIFLFDCMHRDGRDLVDEPLSERHAALAAIAPAELVMPAVRATTIDEATAFQRTALDAGHEGVMVKDLGSAYRSGARGRSWQKVKQFTTVDLVVLAAEWGHGRRKGFLSNLHLGARREDGTFCMVGKTFKGLTDALLRWQTERLQAIATDRDGHVVRVRPELVVEIRFNDVQRSPRYPGGIALRFARVERYREDKPASEADTLASLVARAPAVVAADGSATRTARKKTRTRAVDESQLSLFRK